MDKRNMSLDFELRFQQVQELNPSFDLARVAVAYYGENRNHSRISKEVFDKAVDSMYNIPIVGRYIADQDDFGGHDIIVTEENGRQVVEAATVPFGVVPESAKIGWEEIEEDDGTKREYLVTDCVIWKRSYGYTKLVSQDKWSQSMEITVNDCDIDPDDGLMTIKDMTFNALCILGNGVEPCFESANIQFSVTPDNEEFKRSFSEMLSDLKELTAQETSSEEGKETTMDCAEETEEQVETAEETLEETESTEETEEESEEPNTGSEGDEFSEKQEYGYLGKKKTYGELRDLISMSVQKLHSVEIDADENIIGETDYWVMDFDEDLIYVGVFKWSKDGHDEGYAAISYALTDGGVILGEMRPMFIRWLTAEENARLDAEREELDSLRKYKVEVETEKNKAAVDEHINSAFRDVAETEDFKALGESIYSLDREALDEKLYAIRGKNYTITLADVSDDTDGLRIPVESKKKEKASGRYGDLFATYAIKK